jgi:protein-S-isoprenylcysteine O-methyltransferase Ste14
MSEIYAQETNASRSNGTLHIHPPLLAGSLLVIGLLLHEAARPPYFHHAFPLHQFMGLLFVATGSGLCCYAAALFVARDTTKNPYGEPAAFVTAPPYTFTRNPMYVGLTTILCGFAAFFGSPIMLLGPIIFTVVINQMVIPHEERTMERLYGQQYRDYKSRVARWLPLPSLPH